MNTKADAEAAIVAHLEAYREALETGTRDDIQAFVDLPVAYIAENNVQLRDRYPFDPVKLREITGFRRSDVGYNIIHMDAHKAHVILEGNRHREDDSIMERIEAVYILQKRDDGWKIVAFSGIRIPPETE